MKKAILLFVVLLSFNLLNAQLIPKGSNISSIRQKEIQPGLFGKAISIFFNANSIDSSITISTVIYMVDSVSNPKLQSIQYLRNNFHFPYTAFGHYPVSRQEIKNKVADALKIEIIN